MKPKKALISLDAALCSKFARYALACVLSHRRMGLTPKGKESHKDNNKNLLLKGKLQSTNFK